MKRSLLRLAFSTAFLLLTSLATGVAAQDFQKSYRLTAGGQINISTVSGDVDVAGYDGDQIIVNGFKEGRDIDMVEVEDLSGANLVDIRAKYPRNCRRCDASIRFEVKVPRSTRYVFDSISSASGNIKVTGVTGELKVNTASGDVLVSNVAGEIKASTASGEMSVREIAGTVNASTASGNVDVEIERLEGAESMKFSSASGDVNVRLPSNLDAEVYMATASGTLKTNFPLEIKDSEYGSGSRAEGRLGSGSRRLRISTASGNVSLMTN